MTIKNSEKEDTLINGKDEIPNEYHQVEQINKHNSTGGLHLVMRVAENPNNRIQDSSDNINESEENENEKNLSPHDSPKGILGGFSVEGKWNLKRKGLRKNVNVEFFKSTNLLNLY